LPRNQATKARPVTIDEWWSVTEADWDAADDPKQNFLSLIGRIQETKSGMVVTAYDRCEECGSVCRVYTPSARKRFFSDNEGFACGHCRKAHDTCSYQQQHQTTPRRRKTVASLEAIIAQRDLTITRKNKQLASRDADIASLRAQLELVQQEQESEFEGFEDEER
jgi:hypothetical protein